MRKRKLTEAELDRRWTFMALVAGLVLLTVLACSCTMTPTRTLRRVSTVQVAALEQYVKTANRSIAADPRLSDQARKEWQAVGVKLVRNQRDILQLIEGRKKDDPEGKSQ